jgi:hypothetical protein
MPARCVTLELLRHGSSSSQLLSPLTPYLALSGNYDAETVHVGFEHVELLRRMRGLRYQDSRAAQVSAVEDASTEVSKLVASIRSLTAEISSVPRGSSDVIHLRVVLSAAELALVPFELVRSPAGFPGHGQWLSLQTAAPIALTREVRRVPATTIRWPDRPRILVVAAAPPKVPRVPLRAHLLAMRNALDAWLFKGTGQELGKHVTVIPEASIAAVREACARAAGSGAPYTHVHVLAHGVTAEAHLDGEHAYGLAFHADGDRDKTDVVSGTRLAAALRCHPSGPVGGDLSSPAVVTVASCDSANVGSVIGSGASVAHQLHEAGVPLVLASQFPLSVRGSAIMADVVYTRLLRGEDPRRLVHDLRQALHVGCPDTHDWASVVAYAALPVDIDAQVKRAKAQRALGAVNVAITKRDYVERRGGRPSKVDVDATDAAMSWLESTLPGEDDRMDQEERASMLGALANAAKRAAHEDYPGALWPVLTRGASETMSHEASAIAAFRAEPEGAASDAPHRQAKARRLLDEARRHYMTVFRQGSGEAWPIVQWLALTNALYPFDRPLSSRDRVEEDRRLVGVWTTAHTIADDNLRSRSGRAIVWAHAALAELFVLAQLLPDGHWAKAVAEERAHAHAQELIASDNDLDKTSLLKQLRRYVGWWWQDKPELATLPLEITTKLATMGVGETHVEEA